MTTPPPGPAYRFWLRVQREMDRQGMSLRRLAAESGVKPMTVSRLKTAPARDRHTRRQAVLKLAAALGIDADEALRLAGLELDDSVNVRETVRQSTEYDDDQKQALLSLLDVLDAANRRGDAGSQRRHAG